jgi:hypothetical protein
MLIEVPEERLAKASFVLLKRCKFFPSFAEIEEVCNELKKRERELAAGREWKAKPWIQAHLAAMGKVVKR